MLSEIKERIEGPKYNIDFGGRGWGKQGKGIAMSTTQKGAILRSVSTLLSLIVAAQEWNFSQQNAPKNLMLYKIIEIERFALRAAILDECQTYLGGGGGLGGSEKNRGTVITSLQLTFRRRDRNFTPFTIH